MTYAELIKKLEALNVKDKAFNDVHYVKLNGVNAFNDYIWPTADSTGTKFLSSDGSGNLSWGLPSAGAVAWGDITGTLANQTDLQAALDGKSDVGHTHPSTDISDFSEAVDDRVAALLVEGAGIDLSYVDGSNTLTIASTITQYTDELAQDSVGTILVDSDTIDFTYDDATPSITAIVKDSSITYSKIQNVSATDRLLGRVSASAGVVEEIVFTDFAQSLIDDASAADARTTLSVYSIAAVDTLLSGKSDVGHTHDHTTLTNIGTNTHAQIDTHIASTSNPHSVSLEQARTVNNQISGDIDANSNKIINLATPTAAADAVRKDYVDNLLDGLKWKQSVIAATTADITLSGEQTIDGVSVVAGDRVLVKDQSDQTQNGIYIVAAGAWSRSADANTGTELVSAAVNVDQGTVNADREFVCSNNSITLGSTNITFVTRASTTNHNALSGLQGGTSGEYYHLTSTEHGRLSPISAFGATLIDDADASAARTTLGLVIGTDVQAYDATLLSIAALGTAAGRMIYTTGVDTWAESVITAYGRSLVAAANDVAARILIDAQQADATLTALAGQNWASNSLAIGTGADTVGQVTFAANTFPARGSTGDLVAKTITDFGLDLVDSANAAAAITSLGLDSIYLKLDASNDPITGQLTFDGASDLNYIKLINHSSQAQMVIEGRNSADSASTFGLDGNGRLRTVSSTSSGIGWYSNDLSTTLHMVFNHTSVSATLQNFTGTLSIEGVSGNEIVGNNLGADVNHRWESDTNANFLFLDAGLFSGGGALGIGTTAQADNLIYASLSTDADANNYGLHVVASQTTSRAKTLRGLAVDVSHTGSGTQTGMNGLEFNLTTSGTGTVSNIQGVSANATIGASTTMSNLYLFRAFMPTVNGTLSAYAAFRVETITDNAAYFAYYARAGRITFNDDKTNYSDLLLKGDNDDALLFGDVSADAVGIGLSAPLAKLHVDQSNASGAKPVLTLDQADTSEEFIRLVSAVGAGNPVDTAAIGTYYGKARWYVDGVGAKFVALYNT